MAGTSKGAPQDRAPPLPSNPSRLITLHFDQSSFLLPDSFYESPRRLRFHRPGAADPQTLGKESNIVDLGSSGSEASTPPRTLEESISPQVVVDLTTPERPCRGPERSAAGSEEEESEGVQGGSQMVGRATLSTTEHPTAPDTNLTLLVQRDENKAVLPQKRRRGRPKAERLLRKPQTSEAQPGRNQPVIPEKRRRKRPLRKSKRLLAAAEKSQPVPPGSHRPEHPTTTDRPLRISERVLSAAGRSKPVPPEPRVVRPGTPGTLTTAQRLLRTWIAEPAQTNGETSDQVQPQALFPTRLAVAGRIINEQNTPSAVASASRPVHPTPQDVEMQTAPQLSTQERRPKPIPSEELRRIHELLEYSDTSKLVDNLLPISDLHFENLSPAEVPPVNEGALRPCRLCLWYPDENGSTWVYIGVDEKQSTLYFSHDFPVASDYNEGSTQLNGFIANRVPEIDMNYPFSVFRGLELGDKFRALVMYYFVAAGAVTSAEVLGRDWPTRYKSVRTLANALRRVSGLEKLQWPDKGEDIVPVTESFIGSECGHAPDRENSKSTETPNQATQAVKESKEVQEDSEDELSIPMESLKVGPRKRARSEQNGDTRKRARTQSERNTRKRARTEKEGDNQSKKKARTDSNGDTRKKARTDQVQDTPTQKRPRTESVEDQDRETENRIRRALDRLREIEAEERETA